MSKFLRTNSTTIAFLMVVLIIVGIALLATGTVSILTADQRGYRQYQQAQFDKAATSFADPMWTGVALFRQGEFDQAAGVFAGFDTADSAFNHGNALLLRGNYSEAAERYARALEIKPGWDDAMVNREIALGRAERLDHEGGDMTGGMLGADDIVFNTGQSPPSAGEEQTEGGQSLSEEEIRGLWLRQVQTKSLVKLRIGQFILQPLIGLPHQRNL